MPSVINRHRFLPTPGFGPGGDAPRTGREKRPELPSGSMYVGRGTPLGNPYRVGVDGARDEVLGMYRDWLRERVRRRDPRVMAELARITETTCLVCSCAPSPCHANVIADAWTKLRNAGWFADSDGEQ